jgi:DnaK suppressor protein
VANTPAKATKQKTKARSGGETNPFLTGQRKRLSEERAAQEALINSLDAELGELAEEEGPDEIQFDDESSEGAGVSVDRDRDQALREGALARIAEVDAALARIDDGTYGRCEHCGRPIAQERLRALPTATLCITCKQGGLRQRVG